MNRITANPTREYSWNFPDISGGIETSSSLNSGFSPPVCPQVGISQTSVVGLRHINNAFSILLITKFFCWNFPDISGGIETSGWVVEGYGFDVELEFPRHQWWD